MPSLTTGQKLEKLESCNAQPSCVANQKLAYSILRNLGYSKNKARFMNRVIALLNVLDRGAGSLSARSRGSIVWAKQNEAAIRQKLQWTKRELDLALATLVFAGNLNDGQELETTNFGELGTNLFPEELAQAQQMGGVLEFVEDLANYSKKCRQLWDAMNRRRPLSEQILDSAPELDELRGREEIYNSLPPRYRQNLESSEELLAA